MSFRAASLTFVALFASRTLASCAYGTSLFPRAEEGEVKVNTFGYAGSIGPANWHLLDVAANSLCATGAHQSPIDMTEGTFTVIPASDVTVEIPDMTNGTEFENLGTTVEVIAQGGSMTIGGITHTLAQFHFHLPSEHLDNGMSKAMEMHMVWEGPEGQIAVIGTYIDVAGDGAVAEPPAAEPPAAEPPAAEEPVAEEPAAEEPVDEESDDDDSEDDDSEDDDSDDEESDDEESDDEAPVTEAPAAALPDDAIPLMVPSNPHIHVPARRERQARRELAREQSKARRQAAAPAAATTLLETVLGKVSDIATPGTKVETEPLIMSEVVDIWKAGSFQTYSGSLTTPPCSEGVRWLVSDQTLSINLATFVKARDVIGFNARFPQNFLSLSPPASAVASA